MDKDFLEKIKEELFLSREAIISKMKQNEASVLKSHIENHGDSVDLASEEGLVAKVNALSTLDSNMLMSIENALRRIEEGKYGTCLKCNNEIPKARLEALPSAVLCLACKTEQEKAV